MMQTSEQTMLSGSFGLVRQLGHVVEDIRSSISEWEKQGVGPWLWMRNVQLPCTFRGEASKPVIDVALSYQGDMQIELIQQINKAPSPYLATVESGSYGLHHHAFLCANIHKDVKKATEQGLTMVCDIRMMGSRYVYLQSKQVGENAYYEFLPASLMMKTMIRRGIAASKRWQGGGEPMVIDMKNLATLVASLPAVCKVWLGR